MFLSIDHIEFPSQNALEYSLVFVRLSIHYPGGFCGDLSNMSDSIHSKYPAMIHIYIYIHEIYIYIHNILIYVIIYIYIYTMYHNKSSFPIYPSYLSYLLPPSNSRRVGMARSRTAPTARRAAGCPITAP